MANLTNIVKVTKEQHDTLLSGGDVKGHTYDPLAMYLIEGDIESSLVLKLLAPTFNTSKSYAVGDLCTYIVNGEPHLYKCTAATSGGAFDASKWADTTLFEALIEALGGSY